MSSAAAKLDTGVFVDGFFKGLWLLVTNPGFLLLLAAGAFLLILKSANKR